MNAYLIAVGSEMLTPFRLDTNSLIVTERLNAIGYEIRAKTVVGDDRGAIAETLRTVVGVVELVICTGGLGPTEDDLTRDALAEVLGVPLEVDTSIVERIRERFAKRGLDMPAINARQAMVPKGASVLANRFGTAPGLWAETQGTRIVLLPGPPREMTPMLDAVIDERLRVDAGRGVFRRVLKITGRTESDVDQVAQPIYGPWTQGAVPIATTILAVLGQIELHLSATAASRAEADHVLDPAVRALETGLGCSVYSVDGRPLERVVGDLLRERGWTIAVAESCTGGLLASRLTDVPGSSEYFGQGVVCYSNTSKVALLGVPESVIEAHGAVSEQVALEMATRVRRLGGASVGIGITGIAGPGGGTDAKPVGTVVVAALTEDASRVRTHRFTGAREQIKFQATQAALDFVRLLALESRSRGRADRQETKR